MVAGWFKNCQSCTQFYKSKYIMELLSTPCMLTKNRINIYYLFIICRKMYFFQTKIF